MYLNWLSNKFRWISAVMACFTMAFSPLAIAKETEKVSREQIQNYLAQSGLNKKSTWTQFYEKTKDIYPEEVAKNIAEFVKLNPDKQMPVVKLKSAQSSAGGKTAVLELYENGKTFTIQVFGESDKWAKMSGLTIKESDLENPANGLVRLQTGNINFKKDADSFLAKHNVLPNPKDVELKNNLTLFKPFPRMTPQLWSSMTKNQRKEFLKQIVAVWRAANKVLKLNASQANEKRTSLIENYVRHFLLAEAMATEAETAGLVAAESTRLSSQDAVIANMEQQISENPELLAAYQSGRWSAALDRWLVDFEVAAERRAQEAVNRCISRTSTIIMDSAEVQRAACENFGRELLINETVISRFRETSCRAPSVYIGKYSAGETVASRDEKDQLNRREINPEQEVLCSCSESNTRVKFNEECPAAAATATTVTEQPQTPEPQRSTSTGGNSRNRGNSIWPLAIGGAAVGVLAGLLFFGKDKKKKNAATANTAVAASCPANKVGTPPNCTCGPCTAPQQIYNYVTCQCTNVTANVICPNNEIAPNGDSSRCLKCGDGTYKTTEPCPQVQPANCVGANCGGVRPAIQ